MILATDAETPEIRIGPLDIEQRLLVRGSVADGPQQPIPRSGRVPHVVAAFAKPRRQSVGRPTALTMELHTDLTDSRKNRLRLWQDVPLGSFTVKFQQVNLFNSVFDNELLQRPLRDGLGSSVAGTCARLTTFNVNVYSGFKRSESLMNAGDIAESIQLDVGFNHPYVLSKWFDGKYTPCRAEASHLEREVSNVRPDVYDDGVFGDDDVPGRKIGIQDGGLVEDSEICGSGTDVITQSVAELEDDATTQLRNRQRPPIAVHTRGGQQVAETETPSGKEYRTLPGQTLRLGPHQPASIVYHSLINRRPGGQETNLILKNIS